MYRCPLSQKRVLVRSPRDGVTHGSEVPDTVMEAGTEFSKEQVLLFVESPLQSPGLWNSFNPQVNPLHLSMDTNNKFCHKKEKTSIKNKFNLARQQDCGDKAGQSLIICLSRCFIYSIAVIFIVRFFFQLLICGEN